MNFIEWLESNNACASALEWICEQPDKSLPALLQTCPRGEWILWVYARAGYDFETLSPVVYAAVNRALEYAANALDRVDIKHDLRKHIITDRTNAAAAARAAAYAVADADAEHKQCADDCREFLPPLIIPTVEAILNE